ncbi:FAR1-related sequence 5-like protein [Tanacetum coccineum]
MPSLTLSLLQLSVFKESVDPVEKAVMCKRGMNTFISDRDAQRHEHVPQLSFYHHTINDDLCRMFWADETMKCNYVAVSDIVSFYAIFDTNKYDMVFVPFTCIDHHQKCVTFGVALLSVEYYESYCWLLEVFLKFHVKQPPIAVTDHNGALRMVVQRIFTQSHRRLCMRHITQKRLEKSCSHHGNSLVHFMLCFESTMEKQRYTQRVLDNSNVKKTRVMFTQLPIERHACEGGIEYCVIRQKDKRNNTVVDAMVSFNQLDVSASPCLLSLTIFILDDSKLVTISKS